MVKVAGLGRGWNRGVLVWGLVRREVCSVIWNECMRVCMSVIVLCYVS